MAFLSYLDISVSGIAAQRMRMEIISENVAKAQITNTGDGTPYRRQVVVFAENRPYENLSAVRKNFVTSREFGSMLEMTLQERLQKKTAGVQVVRIAEDPTPFTPVYDPTHPDANADGYYYLSNVDVAEEQMDALAASRAYEANITIFDELKSMASKALTIGRG